MDLSEAKKLLKNTTRLELRDHAFGDREVTWMTADKVVAEGYFASGIASVGFYDPPTEFNAFEGSDACALLECGTLITSRNDSTGPDEFQEGVSLPGLTKDGVRDELIKGEENAGS